MERERERGREFDIPVVAPWRRWVPGRLVDFHDGCFELLVQFDVEEEGWGFVDFRAGARVG